jgi:hypothetical protein
MKLVRIFPSASGCLEIPSDVLAPNNPIPIAPPQDARPIAIPAAIALSPVVDAAAEAASAVERKGEE